MPRDSADPDVVLVLTETDLSSVIAAIDASDKSLIRLTDGSKPTESQIGLIMSATTDDYRSAVNAMHLRAQIEMPYGDGEEADV